MVATAPQSAPSTLFKDLPFGAVFTVPGMTKCPGRRWTKTDLYIGTSDPTQPWPAGTCLFDPMTPVVVKTVTGSTSNTGRPAAPADPFAKPTTPDLGADLAGLMRAAAEKATCIQNAPGQFPNCLGCSEVFAAATGAAIRMVADHLRNAKAINPLLSAALYARDAEDLAGAGAEASLADQAETHDRLFNGAPSSEFLAKLADGLRTTMREELAADQKRRDADVNAKMARLITAMPPHIGDVFRSVMEPIGPAPVVEFTARDGKRRAIRTHSKAAATLAKQVNAKKGKGARS